VLKNIFKRGYEEIGDRKLPEILKKDRTWLKYELHCNVKTPAPLFEDEKMLGRKHIYLLHAQTAIYDSKVKLFLKQGISHQLGRDAVV
jgi:hypothetical protein